MFYFDKKIYYIDYYENGSRISNAGFISLTFKDEDCHVHVGIRNLPGTENRLCRWFGLINSEQVFLEEFRVEKGEADFINCYKRNRLGKTEVDFSALEGFYFALGKRRWGSCFFRNIKQHMEPTFQEKPVKQTAQEKIYSGVFNNNAEEGQSTERENVDPDSGQNNRYGMERNDSAEGGFYAGEINGNLQDDTYISDGNGNSESGSYAGEINGNSESAFYVGETNGNSRNGAYSDGLGDGMEADLYRVEVNGNSESGGPTADLYSSEWKGTSKDAASSDAVYAKKGTAFDRNDDNLGKDFQSHKSVHRTTWEELIETHQLVHPFEDQGDYISINPFTLKLLAPEYRKLANNSFLLHGFYNYRHLILGYYQDEERQGYYIGVPGTFDEREQMVAEMFGFEGYEPAGGVGYYMRKVEF